MSPTIKFVDQIMPFLTSYFDCGKARQPPPIFCFCENRSFFLRHIIYLRCVFLLLLLVSRLRLCQRVDDTVVGWLNLFIVITCFTCNCTRLSLTKNSQSIRHVAVPRQTWSQPLMVMLLANIIDLGVISALHMILILSCAVADDFMVLQTHTHRSSLIGSSKIQTQDLIISSCSPRHLCYHASKLIGMCWQFFCQAMQAWVFVV